MQFSSFERLISILRRIDGGSYKSYREIRGAWETDGLTLLVDHVQGDPFAAPTRVRLRVPAELAGFPDELTSSRTRRVAVGDFLTRRLVEVAGPLSLRSGSGKGGLIEIDTPGQQVLDHTSCRIDDELVEVRFVVGLPAAGRLVLGRVAAEILTERLPTLAGRVLRYAALDAAALRRHVEVVEDAAALRAGLVSRGLVAFVADGAILPRRSGVDERPLEVGAVAFHSPPSLCVELERPNGPPVAGMGIPAGVTLITGGGYHGKSTLLRAIQLGIYDHLPGDGREQVVTHPDAVKIRAEDGRRVERVDISPFIRKLPSGTTAAFSTANASGSTSQAANIVEALEAGAEALLVDEDTSATNFMIRDRRMQALIPRELEPITPFVDRVRRLFEDLRVSTVLVTGGSGDYLDVADTVIAMNRFSASDVTKEARAVAKRFPTGRTTETDGRLPPIRARAPEPASLDPSHGRRAVRLRIREANQVSFGNETIDLSGVEQLVHPSQLRAIAAAMVRAREWMTASTSLRAVLDEIESLVARDGLEAVVDSPRGDLAGFRRFELAAAINRLRSLRVKAAPTRGES